MPKAKVVEEFEYPEGYFGEAKQLLVDQVLWALHLHGPFEDRENGRATAMVAEWLLEEQGIKVPTYFSSVVRDLATDDFGYIDRDCPATRTFRIALQKGIVPGKAPFPPNPFPEVEDDEVQEIGEVRTITVGEIITGNGDTPDASSEGGFDPLFVALEITSLASMLVRELPGQLAVRRSGPPGWVKQVVEDNERLTAENDRLRGELEALQGLVDRLTPTPGIVL
jgi:hypothetical protein